MQHPACFKCSINVDLCCYCVFEPSFLLIPVPSSPILGKGWVSSSCDGNSLFTCVIESYFDICMLSVAGMAGRNCPLLKHQNGCHVHWQFLSYFPGGILCTLLGVSTASVHTPLSLPIKTSKSKG